MTASHKNAPMQVGSRGCAISLESGHPPPYAPTFSTPPQPSVDELEFTRDVIALFGAGRLVSVARYLSVGRAHIEVYGPLPRGWQRIIPACTYRRGAMRIGWRNSRGWRLHPVEMWQICELAAELARQQTARRGT